MDKIKVEQFAQLAKANPMSAYMEFMDQKNTEQADTVIAMGQAGLVGATGINPAYNSLASGFFTHAMEIVKKQVEFTGMLPELKMAALGLLDGAKTLAASWGKIEANCGQSVEDMANDYKKELKL